MKNSNHNEWFRLITKTTCECGIRNTVVYSWGEYVHAKWRTISHVCEFCFPQVINRLLSHSNQCGCTITLVGYRGQKLPDWLKLPQTCNLNKNKDDVLSLAV